MTAHQVLREYHHNHTISNPDGTHDVVSLREHMKSHPKFYQQIQSFEKFFLEKKYDVQQNPEFLLQIAANYSSMDRIKQNARLELEGKPWCPTLTVSWWFFRNPSPLSRYGQTGRYPPALVPRRVWRRWTRGGYPIVRVLLVVCKLTTLHLGRDDRGKENTVSPP